MIKLIFQSIRKGSNDVSAAVEIEVNKQKQTTKLIIII